MPKAIPSKAPSCEPNAGALLTAEGNSRWKGRQPPTTRVNSAWLNSPARYFLAFLTADNGTTFFHGISQRTKPQEGYGLQFYPGVADVQAATALAVRASASVHVTHLFLKQRLFQVSGTVRGIIPESSLDVHLTNSLGESAPGNPQFDPKTGDFQILGIPAGTYLLVAVQFPSPTSAGVVTDPPMSATQTLHVDRDLLGVVLTLGSGISIPVQGAQTTQPQMNRDLLIFSETAPSAFARLPSTAASLPPSARKRFDCPRCSSLCRVMKQRSSFGILPAKPVHAFFQVRVGQLHNRLFRVCK